MDGRSASRPGAATISRGLFRALTVAYRRADRRGRPTVGSDDLLRSMADVVPAVGGALSIPAPAADAGRGPAPGWPPGEVAAAASPEVAGPLRLIRWNEVGLTGRRMRAARAVVPEWAPELCELLGRAAEAATAEGARYTGNRHVLGLMLQAREGPVPELFADHSVHYDRVSLLLHGTWPPDEDRPYGSVTAYLAHWRVLTPVSADAATVFRTRVMGRFLALTAEAGFVLVSLEQDSTGQAVQLGHRRVGQAHLLLAALHQEEQVAAAGLAPAPAYASANRPVLTAAGLTWRDAVRVAEAPSGDDPDAGRMPRRAWRTHPEKPVWSESAARAADRARTLAAADRVPSGARHVVRAVLDDLREDARLMLHRLGADPDRIRAAAHG